MSKRISRFGVYALSLLGACAVPAFAKTTVLANGADLQAAITAADPGDIIALNPGTYSTVTGEPWIHIDKPVAIVGLGGVAQNVVIMPPASAAGAFGLEIRSSNVTIDTVTIGNLGTPTAPTGPATGIAVGGDPVGGPTLTNIVLRHIFVNYATTGHGIVFTNVTNSIIDSDNVAFAGANGIFIQGGSNNNLVMNNIVQKTGSQNGIAIKNSNQDIVAGNVITSAAVHGILLLGARYNRIERNVITSQNNDGITQTVSDDTPGLTSANNYVGQNTIGPNLAASGTGIWLDAQSNGSYVFGNTDAGAAEAGITSFNSSNSLIRANVLNSDKQAGILLWHTDANQPAPSNTVLQNNLIFSITANNNILLRGASNNDIGYNFIVQGQGGIDTSPNGSSGASSNDIIYDNTFAALNVGIAIDGTARNVQVFHNRFVNVAKEYVNTGAGAALDAYSWIGGNYWSDMPTARPYTNFFDSVSGKPTGFQDRYPFSDESLGGVYSIILQAPVDGTIAAAGNSADTSNILAALGSNKTIAWKSQGCFYVDINLLASELPGGTAVLAQNLPDVGFFNWRVGIDGTGNSQTIPSGTDYQVSLTCKRSDLTPKATAVSPIFTVATNNLVLLSPGPEMMLNAGQTLTFGWRRAVSLGAAPVDVYLRYDGGPWQVVASGVTGDSVNVTLPAVNSNRVQAKVQLQSSVLSADSTDRYFTIRGGTPSITYPSPAGGAIVPIGVPVDLEWISRQGSYYVDVTYFDSTDGSFQPIATNLPDYGKYTWFPPERFGTGDHLHLVFKDTNGNTISTLDSGTFKLEYGGNPGAPIPFYRLYSAITREHLYTTDLNEYNVLATRDWSQEGIIGQLYNGPLVVNGIDAIPYYRLYNSGILQHLWTTDRNEYFTLRASGIWTAENFVGYMLPPNDPAAGTLPFYRLRFNFFPYYHVWTTDQNEYNVLPTEGWTQEGVTGYLAPKP